MWNTLMNNLKEDRWYLRSIAFFCYQQWIWIERKLNFVRRFAPKASGIAFGAVAAVYVFFPTIANADIESEATRIDKVVLEMIIEAMQNKTDEYGRLPQSADALARRHFTIPITAYTSDPLQTDDTPCITASGLDVCERGTENVVAANFLPIGTRVKIPELFGDRIFYVEDRMNARYFYRMDIWMKKIEEAKEFGIRRATVEVF